MRGRGDDGRILHFSNTHATGHVAQPELNHQRARQMSLSRFRDTMLWDETNRRPDYLWLNRLQAVSHGQIELVLNHYGLPEWIDEAMFWNGQAAEAMHDLAYSIARHYAGAFRSYNPGVELGIRTDWIAAPDNRQWPFGGRDWWAVYQQTSAIAIAKGLSPTVMRHGLHPTLFIISLCIGLSKQIIAQPQAGIITPQTNLTFAEGVDIPVSLTAISPVGSLSAVELLLNGQKLTTFPAATATQPYSYTLRDLLPASYTLTARAINNAGAVGTSVPVLMQVRFADGYVGSFVHWNFDKGLEYWKLVGDWRPEGAIGWHGTPSLWGFVLQGGNFAASPGIALKTGETYTVEFVDACKSSNIPIRVLFAPAQSLQDTTFILATQHRRPAISRYAGRVRSWLRAMVFTTSSSGTTGGQGRSRKCISTTFGYVATALTSPR